MVSKKRIIEIFTEIGDYRTMQKLFKEIFTPAEIQDVALRWRLMEMLHKGVPQRKIASDLGISLCKITRGSKILKNKNSATLKLIERATGAKNAENTKTVRKQRT